MKKALIIVGSLFGLFVAFVLIGLMIDEGGTVPERIERECKRSYGSQGEAAVLDCRLAMSVRYLKDADQGKANSTYGRIR